MSARHPPSRAVRVTTAVAAVLATAALATGIAAAAPAPTGFLVPPRSTTFDVGGRLQVDGVASEALGFVSRHPPAVVAAWVRERWPLAHTDDQVGRRRILGRVDGHRHLTLVLEATPDGGSRGLWSSADLRSALRGAGSVPVAPPWAPAGSELLQRLDGADAAGGATTTWLLRHGQAPQVVADHLARQLAGERWVLEQRLGPGSARAGRAGRADAELLVFGGSRGRAVATVTALSGGGSASAVVVTRPEIPR